MTYPIIKFCLTLAFFLTYTLRGHGQSDTSKNSPYRVYTAYELPGSVAFLGASILGFRALDRTATLTSDDIAKLDPNQINAFDRPVAYFDPARFEAAQTRSDLFLNLSIASPVLLMLSSRMRKDALDLLGLYTTAHAVNNIIYFASAFPIRRARPLTYNPALPLELKTGEAKSNSFYSGHVSFSTTATFFAAKVLTDYYHIKGWKRLAIFTGAAIPPILVGVNRMEAGKHFRTDVITGFIIGATCGIGIPELHKLTRRNNRLSLSPDLLPNGARGLRVSYALK